MSLGQKTLAIAFLAVAGLTGVLYVAARILIQRSFLALEAQETRNAVERAQNAMNDELAGLAATANDYAAWDRTYEFMSTFSPDYPRKEFQNDTLQGVSVNSVVLIDVAGKIVFFKAYDLVRKEEVGRYAEVAGRLAADPWVAQARDMGSPQTGFLLIDNEPVMIAACPILTSKRAGQSRGVLVMTRTLDYARMERLKTQTRSSLIMGLNSSNRLPKDFREALVATASADHKIVVRPMSSDTVAGYSVLRDVRGHPILILKLEMPRVIFQEGLASLHYFLAALCLTGIVFGTAGQQILQRAVVARLSRLHAEVSQIGVRKELSARVTVKGKDELGNVAAAINHMLQELENSETQFRHIADNIQEVFWIRDALTDEMRYVSLAYESLWEKSRDELYRDPAHWTDSVHPDDRGVVQEMRLQQKQGKVGAAEYRVVRRDGTERWICDRYFPVVDSQGHTRQIAGLAEDITEFRKAEQVLRRSHEELEHLVEERTAELAAVNKALVREEEHFRQLFTTIPLPVWLCSVATHKFLEVNQAAIDHYGYSRDEFLQMTVDELRPPETVEQLQKDLAEIEAGGTTIRERKHRVRDGRLIDVEVSASRVDFTGVPSFLVATHDVTERLRMEVELRHGQKLQAVGELAAGIAHEINTPIQFVGDNVQFLQGAFADLIGLLEKHEQVYEALQNHCDARQISEVKRAREAADLPFLRQEIPQALTQAVEGVTRVTTIVQALRKFSHVDWGPEKNTANLNEALESTLVVASSELKYVADVVTEFGDLPPVKCFIGDLNQVFLNLLVNAAHAIGDVVKSTGQRGQIRLETRTEGDQAVVAIGDTGTGIPAEIRTRIFDPFFTTKGVGKGTGQGLALARAIIVERHGGTLTFDSEIGKGTTFYIRIPLNPPDKMEEAVSEDVASIGITES